MNSRQITGLKSQEKGNEMTTQMTETETMIDAHASEETMTIPETRTRGTRKFHQGRSERKPKS